MHKIFHKAHRRSSKQGYVLLLTCLIISVILAMSFGIFAVSLKEMVLASYLKNSNYAFAAADRGAECALYWDRGAVQDGTVTGWGVFATSSGFIAPAGYNAGNTKCDDAPLVLAAPTGVSATSYTTHFQLNFADGTYAEISVKKENDITTTITSNGYNSATSPRITQRTIEITTNF